MPKKVESKEDKIFEAIVRQREDIIMHMDKQHLSLRGDLGSIKGDLSSRKDELSMVKDELGIVKSELHSVKAAVLDSNIRIKDLQVGQKEIKHTVDIAVTNHESRIRRLEQKVGA